METSGGGEADEPSTPAGGERPDVVMFGVATARRVGAQLRYNGGPWLAEIRYSAALLTMQQRPGGMRRVRQCRDACSGARRQPGVSPRSPSLGRT